MTDKKKYKSKGFQMIIAHIFHNKFGSRLSPIGQKRLSKYQAKHAQAGVLVCSCKFLLTQPKTPFYAINIGITLDNFARFSFWEVRFVHALFLVRQSPVFFSPWNCNAYRHYRFIPGIVYQIITNVLVTKILRFKQLVE